MIMSVVVKVESLSRTGGGVQLGLPNLRLRLDKLQNMHILG
jgi:hypothetical protein